MMRAAHSAIAIAVLLGAVAAGAELVVEERGTHFFSGEKVTRTIKAGNR